MNNYYNPELLIEFLYEHKLGDISQYNLEQRVFLYNMAYEEIRIL